MRGVYRFLAALALVFVLAAVGLFLLRGAIVETAATRALKGSGFDRPQASLKSLSLSRATLGEISAGGPDKPLKITDATLEFDAVALLLRGRARSLRIGAVEVQARLGDNGAVEFTGYRPPPASGRPPPLDRVSVGAARIALATPQGPALITLSGDIDLAAGGEVIAEAAAARAGVEGATFSNARARLAFALKEDGAIDGTGEAAFDIATPLGAAAGAAIGLSVQAADWRGYVRGAAAPLEGRARADIRSTSLDAASAPALAAFAQGDRPALRMLTISGALAADFSAGATSLAFDGGALRLRSDAGDLITLTAGSGPLFARNAQGRSASVKLVAEGRAHGEATLDARAGANGPWTVKARAALRDQALFDYKFQTIEARFDGLADGRRVEGALLADAFIARGAIGSLVFVDAPTRLSTRLSIDLAGKSARADLAEGACAAIDAARMRLVGQEARLGLEAARLCAKDGAPLVAASWSGPFEMTVASAAAARKADYTLGQTTLKGAPPTVAFAARYRPTMARTDIEGGFAGGDMALNDALRLTRGRGAFTALIEGVAMSVDAKLDEVVVAQIPPAKPPGAEPIAAPVRADGGLRLARDVATFAFNVRTLRGAPLGKGEGRHDVKSGKGSARFNAGDLLFRRGALQPDDIALPLKGVVSDTSGAATGAIDFAWEPGAAASSADFLFAGVSFNGPTLAVTRTEGVSGELALESLAPLKSRGVQTLSIDRVDLDALKLEKGAVEFELPGDETVRIVKAEFPWFGGRIGAYGTSAPLTGGSATTRLEIAEVDLSALLAFLEVEGLSGEGVVEGVLPISFSGGKARIEKGVLSATGPGVVRYESKSTDAAASQSAGAELAFEILRELRFTTLTAEVDGPLDGELDFKILFEGFSDLPVNAGGARRKVESPVIYRINIEAPLLALIDQARITTDYELLRDRALKSIEE